MLTIEKRNGVPTSVVVCDGCGDLIYEDEMAAAAVETIREPDGKTRVEHRHEDCASGATRIKPVRVRPKADPFNTSLKSRFDEGARLTPREALDLMHSLLYALGELHDRRIIHRNLHPGCVLVGEDGGVTITGLQLADGPGLTRAADHGEFAAALVTMSPEQIEGTGCDARSDIFQAGVIFYQMLTGQPPFPGSGAFSKAEKILREDPAPPSSVNPAVPAALDAVLQRALAKDPNRRYERAAEFAGALVRAVPELHTVLRPSVSLRAKLLRRLAIGLAQVLIWVGRLFGHNIKPIANVQEAQRAIQSYKGKPENFHLSIAEELLDPAGINMAIITDSILAREWELDGYFQETGYRTYKFKRLGS